LQVHFCLAASKQNSLPPVPPGPAATAAATVIVEQYPLCDDRAFADPTTAGTSGTGSTRRAVGVGTSEGVGAAESGVKAD
jgi:hypothetical protein